MTIRCWHFLGEDKRLRFPPNTEVEVGQTLTFDGDPILCQQGYHGSKRLIDALQYAPGPVLTRCDIGGEIVEGDDKLAGQTRTVLWVQDITTLLHEFACDEAEQALNARREAGDEIDPRSTAAIEAKRQWLRGEISDQDMAAARAAAWDAARAAAWAAARDAAWDAAWAAAWDAAWDAARDAARAAAWGAARAAAWDAASNRLAAKVMELGAPE